jgi:cyanophycinase
MKINSALAVLVAAAMFAVLPPCVSQTITDRTLPKAVQPISGTLVLAGVGELADRSLQTFAWLAGESDGKLVIVSSDRDNPLKKQLGGWLDNITVIPMSEEENSSRALTAISTATAVWLSDDFSDAFAQSFMDEKLKQSLVAVLERNGVVGGQGKGAQCLATNFVTPGKISKGLDLLPNSIVDATSENSSETLRSALKMKPARVGWEIPPGAFVVVHDGRRVGVIGPTEINIRVAARGDWPERVQSFGPPIDDLPYTTDLMAWSRSAQARTQPRFPPKVAPTPAVANGTLIIIGGGGSTPDMWTRLIDSAGGKDANYVCLSQSDDSYGANKLQELGCQNVQVFHSYLNGKTAPGDGTDIVAALEYADAVYLGGGRTFRFMDAYQNTKSHQLMRNILAKGGVIAGTSAGAQIQGDFLVRGDPRTNQTLWYKGNDTGLGFIRGVIIDAHFRQRQRHKVLPDLLKIHPQMLGIGIDEATAIVVTGTTAEVLGRHSVSFYDYASKPGSEASPADPVVLSASQKYDLKNRKLIERSDN